MLHLTDWFAAEPYSLNKHTKSHALSAFLSQLTTHHFEHCLPYRRMLTASGYHSYSSFLTAADIPFLPVRLFKDLDLRSVLPQDVIKTMTSSGTTGQAVSKIFLDRDTSANQTKALAKIVCSFIGAQRLPVLFIDSPSVISNRNLFSARGAGILGFSLFASHKTFALDENMNLDHKVVEDFLEKHKGKSILVFGFTFMVWQHFYKELLKSEKYLDLSHGILIHGGGWKKLVGESVAPADFKNGLRTVCGLNRVHDYYGMVEQTGSVFMECEQGALHASVFSDVIVRRPLDFSPAVVGERGIIETLSVLPGSYPGHALLTEDEGVILGEDNCPCGRLGKYFKVFGRLQNAEVRGCSDTYATRFS